MPFNFIRLSLILSICMLGAQAFAQGEGLLLDEIVAKVDNRILMRSEFDIRLFQYKTTAIEIGEKDKTCAVFESMLVEKLLLAKADIDSVYVEEEQVTATLDQRMQYFIAQFGSAKKLEAAYGKTIDELKNELKDQVKDQLVARKMQDNITSKIKITPAEVRRFFAKIPVDSLPFFPAEVEVAQIVKYAAISRAQKAEAKKKLELLKERVLSGEKFEELALLYSDDLGSRKAGGELDFRKRGELVPEFEAAALKLKPGEMSEIVESPFGFHLIQLIARKGNEFNSRHILIKPGSSSVDVSEAVQYLDSLRALILLDTISFEKAARSYSDDKVTAANGGFFYDRENNTKRLPLEALDPGVFFTIDTMDVGQISTPVTYRTPDDKEAARIIYYKLKIPPHQANLVDDYEKIYNAALENKKAEAIEKWFDKVKKDVFISSHEDFKNCDVLKQ